MFHVSRFKFHGKGGFTILELIIFAAIFSIIAIAFVGILISVVRVQSRESASGEVNRQSQFLMHTIQRYIEESSMVSINEEFSNDLNTTSSQVVLRMASSTGPCDVNPPSPGSDCPSNAALTRIYFVSSTGQIYLQENYNYVAATYLGVPQALTSDRIFVDQLEFKKHANPSSHDLVDVLISLHYNTPNIQKRFAQILQTSVARVNAAVFDSDIVPSSTANNLNLGVVGKTWASVNGVISFNGDSVGIQTGANTQHSLEISGEPVEINTNAFFLAGVGGIGIGTTTVDTYQNLIVTGNGGLRLWQTGGKPTCNSDDRRGLVWFLRKESSGLSNDYLQICMYAYGSIQWVNLYATSTNF
ncbi:MAG: hypothetical protein HY093_00220 [Candidatus Liptonbacteria bacterium]|nr:hypothetical protein [Candidatus Liptonbacteria bacterium]